MPKQKVEIVELTRILYGVEGNVNRVPRAQWRKWGSQARKVFNEVYSSLYMNRLLTCHPKAPEIPQHHWRTIAWNAAWLAADATERGFERLDRFAKTLKTWTVNERKIYELATGKG